MQVSRRQTSQTKLAPAKKENGAIEKSRKLNSKPKTKITSEFGSVSLIGLVLAGVAIIIGLLVYLGTEEEPGIFAKLNDTVVKKVHHLPCSDRDYPEDALKFGVCVPTHCKRIVKDNLISEVDIENIIRFGNHIFDYGKSKNRMSWVSLHSGKFFKERDYVDIYKLPEANKIFTKEDLDTYGRITDTLKEQISQEFGVSMDLLHVCNDSSIAKMNYSSSSIESVYYNAHVDKELDKSNFYTAILYLSNYKEDFQGGRLMFFDEGVNMTVDPKKGRAVMFTSGYENLHGLERVTSGIRMFFISVFTCDRTLGFPNPTMKNITKGLNPKWINKEL